MKFLLFNMVVTASLIYLLFGASTPPEVRAHVQQAIERVDNLVGAARQNVMPRLGDGLSEPAVDSDIAPEPALASRARLDRDGSPASETPSPTAEPTTIAVTATSSTPPEEDHGPSDDKPDAIADMPPGRAAPVVGITVKTLPALDDPAIAQRRAEVMETDFDQGPAPEAQPTATAPGERKRALHKLAEEMELMFVEKTGR
mgnify:CR=1 FL=1|jgi:hypothetical protein